MEEVVLNEIGAVNFRFFFLNKDQIQKKKMEESQKSKKMKESVPFNKQTTTEQEELSFTKQMLVLYN